MKCFVAAAALAALLSGPASAFIAPSASSSAATSLAIPGTTSLSSATLAEAEDIASSDASNDSKEMKRRLLKRALLGRLGGPSPSSSTSSESNDVAYDAVLADPLTKDPLAMSFTGPILGGGGGSASRSGIRLSLRSSADSDRVFGGRTNTYINLLEPVPSNDDDDKASSAVSSSPILSTILTMTPPPLRSIVANVTNSEDVQSYVPMRDLFTSPSVSFAYERGWRQGFAAAGFPGADEEFKLATEYFAPAIERRKGANEDSVLVDMSCATGLFTRRFAKSKEYSRVIACDYSDSMLTEARRRIRADSEISPSPLNKLDLVRCDVASIPMGTGTVDAFHAGAAMHCWPEIEKSLEEIHRVLVPGGGRYFATTFLGNYFENVARAERATNGGSDPEMSAQAFQYFPSVEYLRDLLLGAGFEEDKVDIEVVGSSCVIIRCEK